MQMLRIPAAALLLVFVLPACGDDPADPSDEPITEVMNELIFTRQGGATIDFGAQAQTLVWCGPWENDLPIPTLHIWVGTVEPAMGWRLKAVVADVTLGAPIGFPNSFIWDQPRKASLYVLDPPNEASTAAEDASGTVVFDRLACGEGGEVDVTIDAVVGSELGDGSPITVQGRFRAPVGEAPPFSGRGS